MISHHAKPFLGITVCGCWILTLSPALAKDELPKTAATAMKKAARYYSEQVATHGGYVYHYSLDLQQRWGEGPATRDQIWVQPPGTPTVDWPI